MEDFELSILVQLFSSPQQQEAARTRREPVLNWKLPLPSKLNVILAMVTSIIANVSFLESVSLKIRNARHEVATISKLLSRDAFAEFVEPSPSINRIGAAISNRIIPIVYGNSALVNDSECSRSFVIFP